MSSRSTFPLAKPIAQISALLDIDPNRIVRRALLPRDFLQNEGKGGTPAQLAAVWNAIEVECVRPDLALHLAKAMAHGPFLPAMFAFSCSPDVETGLRRLAVFKPLIGPLRLSFQKDKSGFTLTMSHVGKNFEFPQMMAVFENLFILEAARTYTAAHIVPLAFGVPDPEKMRREDLEFAGQRASRSATPFLKLSLADASRPLITENSEAWPDFEKRMRANLAEQDSDTRVTIRARNMLLDMLPAGEASVEALCERLAMSKRSLQRHLKSEGESFQGVLAATRSELAVSYLSKDELSVEEISHLLAYREPNSFYRAFQSWTGMTPLEARGVAVQ